MQACLGEFNKLGGKQMFLKRLDVVGFKSFADQVSVDFVPGVTAVVGPNGSGKSNIADSIRWVLGEQSAKSLRGAKMEDIIFAGSDGRKPLNFAEVTLVLDNTDEHLGIDYSEVSVTRRVYRSGESEYLINKQSCRLKDIVDLFLDSGLGKEAYSIIGQGKVDEILNSKAEERRVIFEEAAGVLKYKTRKVTAEKRLVETEENLNRVEDILHELSEQVEPLQIQASIAKDYLYKREQLKEVDISLQVYEITELHRRWTDEKEKLQEIKERTEHYQKKLEKMEEERLCLREKATALSTSYHEAQEELLTVSEEFEKNTGRRQLLEERKKNASQNKEQIERQLQEKSVQLERVYVEWKQESEKKAEGKQRLKQLEEIILKKKALVNRSHVDTQEHIEQVKADYIEVLNEQASLRNERRYLEEQKRQLHLRQERFFTENESVIKKREHLNEQLKEAESFAHKEGLALEKNSELFREKKQAHERKKELYRKKETELYETYQLTQRLQSRADVLAEMQADFSGFFQGVKTVLKARERLPGVIGAVAELVQVPKEYETALEIALGGASQHIVVKTEEDARKAIQYLKQTRSGRATFLPLAVIKPRAIPPRELQRLEGKESFVGVAATLLSVQKTYEPIMFHLLGHVLVARDLEGANEVARLTGYRYRVVTLEGDVVSPGGAMTGGTVKQQQTPLLGRKRELASLQQKLAQLKEVTSVLEQDVKHVKAELKNEEDELERTALQLEKLRASVQEVRVKVRELSREVELSQAECSRFDREKQGFTMELTQIETRLAELDQFAQEAELQAKKLEAQVKSLESELQEQLHSREKFQEELVTDQINLATEKERYAAIEVQTKRLTEEKEKLEEELIALKDEHKWLIGEISSETNGTGKLEERIQEGERRKEELTAALTQMKEERSALDHAYSELEQTIKKQQEEYASAANACQEIEVKVNRIDVELDSRLNHLSTEYEISFEAAQEQYPLSCDPEEARTKVGLIKLGIEELGTVNLGAIEEYERIRERFEFLTEQRADLVEAKTTLHQVISELDEEMTTRFHETYNRIRSEFQRVFKQLFGGGEADLVLTDPNSLLYTGVELVARPPGKKMQHLGLLSGGERALTAIGLLFAILRVRPVPFCVLDEVEAALDEANVGRFAHFLKDFSVGTQFIVITHRKGTMEEADALYGVTMQESGVSKLVSVKLAETAQMMVES